MILATAFSFDKIESIDRYETLDEAVNNILNAMWEDQNEGWSIAFYDCGEPGSGQNRHVATIRIISKFDEHDGIVQKTTNEGSVNLRVTYIMENTEGSPEGGSYVRTEITPA